MTHSLLHNSVFHASYHNGDVNIFTDSACQFTRNYAAGNARVQYGHNVQGEFSKGQSSNWLMTNSSEEYSSQPATSSETAIPSETAAPSSKPSKQRKARTSAKIKGYDHPEITISNARLRYTKHDRSWYIQYRVVRVADDDPDETIRGRTLVVIDNNSSKEDDAVLCLAFHRHFEITGREEEWFFETNTRAYTNCRGDPPHWAKGDSFTQQAPIVVEAERNCNFLENTWLDGRRRRYLHYSSKVALIGEVCESDDSFWGVGDLDNQAQEHGIMIED